MMINELEASFPPSPVFALTFFFFWRVGFVQHSRRFLTDIFLGFAYRYIATPPASALLTGTGCSSSGNLEPIGPVAAVVSHCARVAFSTAAALRASPLLYTLFAWWDLNGMKGIVRHQLAPVGV